MCRTDYNCPSIFSSYVRFGCAKSIQNHSLTQTQKKNTTILCASPSFHSSKLTSRIFWVCVWDVSEWHKFLEFHSVLCGNVYLSLPIFFSFSSFRRRIVIYHDQTDATCYAYSVHQLAAKSRVLIIHLCLFMPDENDSTRQHNKCQPTTKCHSQFSTVAHSMKLYTFRDGQRIVTDKSSQLS